MVIKEQMLNSYKFGSTRLDLIVTARTRLGLVMNELELVINELELGSGSLELGTGSLELGSFTPLAVMKGMGNSFSWDEDRARGRGGGSRGDGWG
jgi:hypothetical protein